MNITSTRINYNRKPQIAVARNQESSTFSGVKDGFSRATQTVIDNPVRSITNAVSLGTMAGSLATMGGTSANATFMQGAGITLGVIHGVAAFGRGIDGLASIGYRSQLGMEGGKQAISAVGDLMSCAGHLAMQAGVTTPAAALVIGGALVSSAFDYNA